MRRRLQTGSFVAGDFVVRINDLSSSTFDSSQQTGYGIVRLNPPTCLVVPNDKVHKFGKKAILNLSV